MFNQYIINSFLSETTQVTGCEESILMCNEHYKFENWDYHHGFSNTIFVKQNHDSLKNVIKYKIRIYKNRIRKSTSFSKKTLLLNFIKTVSPFFFNNKKNNILCSDIVYDSFYLESNYFFSPYEKIIYNS